jgi:tetratricopeptide (TPR) repeat protein/tRNA A-37 threonylcarbamoyl transferase component Bud32
MSDLLGTRISHYRIIDFLSKGGMGEVYVGFDEKLNRRVVMKSIRAEHRLIAEAKTRFLREARILSKLANPNICQIFDYIEGDTADFLVLELIPGRSLAEAITDRMEYREKLRIARQIAAVLVATHAQGIIHRDLKPDNIMLTDKGQVKVLDFGLSRSQKDEITMKLIVSASGQFRSLSSVEDRAEPVQDAGQAGPSRDRDKLTEVGMVMGTLQYMSPEQARGGEATTASDLYSFGLMLQELFTGNPAYDRVEDFEALQRLVISGKTRAVAGIDAGLAALIERLKSMAPAARPTAVDVAERLDWIHDKPARRRKKTLLAAGIAALVIFAAAMAVQTRRAVRAEKSAEAEAMTAKQVSTFLADLFKVSDPNEGKGGDITVRKILDEGARRIAAELSGQPLIQARLMDTMGIVHINLGLYRKAEELLRKALQLRRSRLSPNHPDVLASTCNLALAYQNQGRYVEAEPLLRRALTAREKALDPDHPDIASSLNSLATLFRDQGKLDDAEPLYRRSLAIREKALEPDHLEVANTLNNLAILFKERGGYGEAEPLYRRSLAIREKALGPDHPDVASSLNNLAELLREKERYAEAEPLYRRSLGIWEKVLGPDHPDVAMGVNNLAILFRRQGKFAEAETFYRRSLRIRENSLGGEHPDVAASLNNLANLYNDQGKHAAAEPLLRRSLEILTKVLGAEHPNVAVNLYNLACLSALQGKRAQALSYLARSLPVGGNLPWMQAIGEDRDLVSLHGDPEFARIVAEVQRRAGEK